MSKRFAVLGIGLALGISTLSAETVSDSLGNAQLSKQLEQLENTLQINERVADNWWTTWVALYGTATLGQGAVALATTDKSTRQDMILGSGTTLLGIVSQLITPVHSSYKRIEKDSIAKLSFQDKRLLLLQREEQLKKQADISKACRSWQFQTLSGAVNLASGVITWIGFDRSFGEGLFNFALNTVITEAQVFTQPLRAKRSYDRYMQSSRCGSEPARKLYPVWYGAAYPSGCSVGIRF